MSKIILIFILFIGFTMNQAEIITVPKVDVNTPHGVSNKPFTGGTLYFNRMKRTKFPKRPGIYVIQSIINNKKYVGSTVNFRDRKWNHFGSLKNKSHGNYLLQRHYNKHGEVSLFFKIIESIPKKSNETTDKFKGRLIKREQYWINALKPEFNICKIAYSCLGVKRSEKFKQNHRGKNNVSKNPEVRRKQSEAKKKYWENHNKLTGKDNPFFGKSHTKETLQKISKAKKGKLRGNKHALGNRFSHTPEALEKIRNLWKNPEYRKKQNKSRKGRIPWNKGLKGTYHTGTSGMKGKHHSEETKKKISIRLKNFHQIVKQKRDE